MEWDGEALQLLKKVPFFVRSRAKREIEALVKSRGGTRVTARDVLEARQAVAERASRVDKGYHLETCFGNGGCPRSLKDTEGLIRRLEEVLEKAQLLSFLRERVEGPLRHSHVFRVGVANCPNACSRVHILDFGVIARERPTIEEELCNGCGSCLQACLEGAIDLEKGVARIKEEACLLCGDCRRACPQGAIKRGGEGYSLLLGGKLGRHPQLARTLFPMATEDQVVEALERVLDLYKAHNTKGERLGSIIQRMGWKEWERIFHQTFSGEASPDRPARRPLV